MKLNSMQQMSVLACTTGLVLALLYALAFLNKSPSAELLAMLVAAVGGFEMYLFAQDVRRKRLHG